MTETRSTENYSMEDFSVFIQKGKIYEHNASVLDDYQERLDEILSQAILMSEHLKKGNILEAAKMLEHIQHERDVVKNKVSSILENLYQDLGHTRDAKDMETRAKNLLQGLDETWTKTSDVRNQAEIFLEIQRSADKAIRDGNWTTLSQIARDGQELFCELFGEECSLFSKYLQISHQKPVEEKRNKVEELLRSLWVGAVIAVLGVLALLIYLLNFAF
jgi:hypothetical protein